MIVLRNLTKSFRVGNRNKYIARNISAVFPAETSVALLGRNGAGKSSLLKVIGGTMSADSGKVLSTGRISWQIGFAGSFHGDLTGAQNARFIARIYGIDTESLLFQVQEFAELGSSFFMPFRTYSSGMKARFAFGVSMAIPFSYYLIDEVTSVGDASFKAKCSAVLQSKLANAGAIVVSHSDSTLRSLCSAGAVLENGILSYYDDIEDAIAHHNRNMGLLIGKERSVTIVNQTPRELYLSGRKALDEGDHESAVSQITAAIAAEPANAGWQAGLGVALQKAGRLNEALEVFQTAARLNPTDPRHSLSIAGLLMKLGKFIEALNFYRLSAEMNPSSVPAWFGVAKAASELGDESTARSAYYEVLSHDPEHLAGNAELARYAEQEDDLVSAEKYSRVVADLRSGYAPAQISHARILMKLGQFGDAARRYRQVLEIQPNHPSATAILLELDTWGEAGDFSKKAASAVYYDTIYAEKNHYSKAGTDLVNDGHFQLIIDYLKMVAASSVLDVGCGPGQFAEFLRSQLSIRYHGLDFSKVAISKARDRMVTDATFEVFDVTKDVLPAVTPNTALVCTEVLEHVVDDLAVIEALPQGYPCCCSVPSFYTFSHVRHFTLKEEVVTRYARFFDNFEVFEISLGAGNNRLYLFTGMRNSVMR